MADWPSQAGTSCPFCVNLGDESVGNVFGLKIDATAACFVMHLILRTDARPRVICLVKPHSMVELYSLELRSPCRAIK